MRLLYYTYIIIQMVVLCYFVRVALSTDIDISPWCVFCLRIIFLLFLYLKKYSIHLKNQNAHGPRTERAIKLRVYNNNTRGNGINGILN